ncbi:hypothetical protein [Nibribacter koreensis]
MMTTPISEVHVQSFKMKKGQILVSEATLRIQGDSARKNKWLIVAATLCFTLLIGFRVYAHFFSA